jgi:hypothetical protein
MEEIGTINTTATFGKRPLGTQKSESIGSKCKLGKQAPKNRGE